MRRVLALGAHITIDSDSHLSDNLPWIRLGVLTARRGWAEHRRERYRMSKTLLMVGRVTR